MFSQQNKKPLQPKKDKAMYPEEQGIVIGIDNRNNKITFKAETYVRGNNIIYASSNDLISIKTQGDVHTLYCWNNNLTTLELPKKIQKLYCGKNNITTLALPNGIKVVYCHHNKLKELQLPDSLMNLRCDHDLFNYNTCKVRHVDIVYPDVDPSVI